MTSWKATSHREGVVLLPEPFTAAGIVARFSRCRAAWFSLDGRGDIYLRNGSLRLVDHRVVKSLDMSRVEVFEEYRRQGVFASAVEEVERAAVTLGVDCVVAEFEFVLDPVVRHALWKRGYRIEGSGLEVYAHKFLRNRSASPVS